MDIVKLYFSDIKNSLTVIEKQNKAANKSCLCRWNVTTHCYFCQQIIHFRTACLFDRVCISNFCYQLPHLKHLWIFSFLESTCVKLKARGPNLGRHNFLCGPWDSKLHEQIPSFVHKFDKFVQNSDLFEWFHCKFAVQLAKLLTIGQKHRV